MHVQPVKMRLAADAGEIGFQPVIECGQQRGVREVRPAIIRVQASDEHDACLEAHGALAPRQGGQPHLTYTVSHGLRDHLRIGHSPRAFLQHQCAEPAGFRGADGARAASPEAAIARLDLIAEMLLDFLERQGRREMDLLVARGAIGCGHCQEVLGHQRVMLWQNGPAAA